MRTISGASEHEKPGQRAEDDEDEPEERRGDPPGAGALFLHEELAEDRHERGAESGVRSQRAHEVRNLERDREGVDLALDPEGAPHDDLADEPEDPRETRDRREDGGRPREPPPRPARGLAATLPRSPGRG